MLVRPFFRPSGVISPNPFSGFSNNYTQMIVIIRGRSTRKTQDPASKVKVTLRGQRSKMGTKMSVRSHIYKTVRWIFE